MKEELERALLVMPPQVRKAFDKAVESLKPVVADIEKSVPGTKNHYGIYMSMLSEAKGRSRTNLAFALLLAGANEKGVVTALKLVNGIPLT